MSFLISIIQDLLRTLFHAITFTQIHIGNIKFSFIGINHIISAILKYIK